MLRSILPAIALAAAIAAPATAIPPPNADAPLEKPIRQMEQGFNTGNIALARAAHVPNPDIIDELGAPFHWSGKGSFDRWLADLAHEEKRLGKSDGHVELGSPTRVTVAGRTAYVITPSTYSFRQNGKTLREQGTITFVLVKPGADWKISAWTWTSPEAKPVG